MTQKQAIQKQLDHAKSILTEKGYRDYLKRYSSLSTEYFQNGGRFNINDYEKKVTIITNPFAVLDALGGDITGEYQDDLKRLEKRGKTCSVQVYNEAYQMSEQP